MISQIEQFPDDGNEYRQKNRQLQYMYNCSSNINFHCKCLIFDTTWIYEISLAWQKYWIQKDTVQKPAYPMLAYLSGHTVEACDFINWLQKHNLYYTCPWTTNYEPHN